MYLNFMETADVLALVAVLMSTILWPAGWLCLWRIRLVAGNAPPEQKSLSLSVIIPARNEEHRIRPLLDSLKSQTLKPDEIIVVDDESEDATAEIIRSYGFRLVSVKDRPPGWLGKSYACHVGSREAEGRWLLFLDADTRLEDDAVERLVSEAGRTGGIITLQPFHRIEEFYENLSAFFNVVVLAGTDAFGVFSKPGRPAGGFGPCILVSKKDYEAVGGHEAVRSSVVEDVAFVAAAVKKNIPVHTFGGRGLIEFRMYPEGPTSLRLGWIKNMATAAGMSSGVSIVLLSAWITGMMATLSFPVLAFAGAVAMYTALMPFAWAAYTVQTAVHFRRVGNFSYLMALFYPVPVLYFIFIFFWSVSSTRIRGSVKWKGRDVAVGR